MTAIGPGGERPAGPHFADRLAELVAERESQVVLGLDPDPQRLWPDALLALPARGGVSQRAAAAVTAHCSAVIDAAAPAVVAVKLQLACFERLGAAGRISMGDVVRHAQSRGLLVIADGKRGDIDVSAAAYAQALLTACPTPFGEVAGLGADAVTASPYMGIDTLRPLVAAARAAGPGAAGERRGAGVFVLVRTSNPGAADVEDLELAGGGTVWEHVARIVTVVGDEHLAMSGLSDVGAVVGATAPQHIGRMRELMPRAVFLLPGVGAQGGRVEDLAAAFAPGPAGGLITASRSIVHAHERASGTPAGAARAEAERLRAAVWSLC